MEITKVKLLEHGVLINDSITLPHENNGHVRQAYNAWLKEGNEPESEHTQVELDEIKAWDERAWRNEQLAFADIEINKHSDNSDIMELEWRSYRIALRAYPEKAGFPASTRPIVPK